MKEPTEEQKDRMRVRCAQLCGYKKCRIVEFSASAPAFLGIHPKWHEEHGLPDYPRDLNAMHDAEKTLESDDRIVKYMENLTDVCGGDTPEGTASFTAYFAEAWQRTLAFIRVFDPTYEP